MLRGGPYCSFKTVAAIGDLGLGTWCLNTLVTILFVDKTYSGVNNLNLHYLYTRGLPRPIFL